MALIFAPDSVSWLLNVRGTDMPQLPVLQSLALLRGQWEMTLCRPGRFPGIFPRMWGRGCSVLPEDDAVRGGRLVGRRVLADARNASAWMQLELVKVGATLVRARIPY